MTDQITTPHGKVIHPGDTITYQPTTGPARTVLIDSVSEDLKDGYAGFTGTTVDDAAPVWGYADQVI